MSSLQNISINNRRIAKNTLLLYVRMLLTMGVSLYTSRVVLDALGVEDYGIYNVVGGVVAMFSFFNGSMTAATQRFLSYAIGKNDSKLLQDTFNQTVTLHIFIAGMIVLLGECVGYWFVTHKLSIPLERMETAILVFHSSLLCLLLNVIQVPYNAMIIARERMDAYAYFCIVEVLLKLGVAFAIVYTALDKLKIYSLFLFFVAIVTLMLYVVFCRFRFGTKTRLFWNKHLCKSLAGFAGWNLSAHFALLIRTQGVNILLNVFFGPVLNAARGIAVQVNGAIFSFVNNFQMAVNPQLVKSYAQRNFAGMWALIYRSSKLSFLLLSMLVVPFYLECDQILSLWLKSVPDYAILFARLSLIALLADTLSGTLGYGALATGKVRNYQLSLSSFFLLNPVLVYVLFKFDAPPFIAYVVEIGFNFGALFLRLYFLKKLIGISIKLYVRKVVVISLVILMLNLIFSCIVKEVMMETFLRILVLTTTSIFVTAVGGYLIGLTRQERKTVNQVLENLYNKYIKHGLHFNSVSRNRGE